MHVTGWRCLACGATRPVSDALPWRCPAAGLDDHHHVLVPERALAPLRPTTDDDPLLAFDRELAWAAFADAHGMDERARATLVDEFAADLVRLDGRRFHRTPFARSDVLSDALGFTADGGVWVKDETHNVGGSHKARHLVTILLHLLAAERTRAVSWVQRPPLAIASCGNAALAAATLAAAAAWPIRVFVPPSADVVVLDRLASLGASIEVCPRLDTDPPGDPCMHRCREAVAAGAIPFTVQGPENALCLDGGRTIGWEIAIALEALDGRPADRVFVQTGGGAFVACMGAAFAAAGVHPQVHAVQTEGCAPLARAWSLAAQLEGGRAAAGRHWSACMTPWDQPPSSLADGILDDETYDWLGAFAAMRSGGFPVVATERDVVAAYDLAHATTTIDVSPTGAAGLAGLLAVRDQVAADERVVVVFSGVRRGTPRPPGVA